MNQSKLNVIMCSWREAREDACERLATGFGFTSDWMKIGTLANYKGQRQYNEPIKTQCNYV